LIGLEVALFGLDNFSAEDAEDAELVGLVLSNSARNNRYDDIF